MQKVVIIIRHIVLNPLPFLLPNQNEFLTQKRRKKVKEKQGHIVKFGTTLDELTQYLSLKINQLDKQQQ